MRITRSTGLSLVACAAALLVAAGVRSLNHAGVFTGGGVILWEVDPFYHVRRIWLTVLHYPHVPVFDSYLCFPEGAVCPWPPGFDFTLATLVKVLAGPGAGLLNVKTITAWAIPWLGGLTCALAAWIAARFWGAVAALATGLALAVIPAQVETGLIGRVDHHVVESLFFAILAGRFLWGAGATTRGAMATGLVFALSHLFWTGTPIFGVVAAGAAILLGGSIAGVAGRLARAFAWSAAFLVPIVLAFPPDPRARLSFEMLSWFHPLFFCALAVGTAAADRVFSLRTRASARAIAIAVVIALVGIALLLGPAAAALRAAFAFVLRSDQLSATTTESAPLSLAGAWKGFSWIAVTGLPALAALAWRAWCRRASTGETRLLAWVSASFAVYLLMPSRLAPHASVSLALLYGWAAASSVQAAHDGPAGTRRLLFGVAAAALAGAFALTCAPLRPTRIVNGTGLYAGTDEALEWLREHTPPTSGFDDPRGHPEYSVLSDWGRGFWIVMVAERPAVGSPFLLLPWFAAAARDGSDYAFAENEEAALDIAARRRARYVITSPINALGSLASSSGRDPRRYFENRPGRPFFPPFFRMINTRLLLLDGREVHLPDGGTIPALEYHRLRFESSLSADWSDVSETPLPGTWETRFPLVKVFELVRGGRIEGLGPPGAIVHASVPVKTNRGRTFSWETSTTADARGRFRLRVPYPNAPATLFSAGTDGPYRLYAWGREGEIRFTEEEIEDGSVKRVVLQKRPASAAAAD